LWIRLDQSTALVRHVAAGFDPRKSPGPGFAPSPAACTDSEIDTAFEALAQHRIPALVVAADTLFVTRRDKLVALAARQAVPAMYSLRDFATTGGLMSYGVDLQDMYRQAGVYAGRILKGAKPADLPVMQPTKFELVINLKTAKSLGLTLPSGLPRRYGRTTFVRSIRQIVWRSAAFEFTTRFGLVGAVARRPILNEYSASCSVSNIPGQPNMAISLNRDLASTS
jgi:hypothetical protein